MTTVSTCKALLADEKVKAILDNPFEGIMAIDSEGVIFFANAFFMEMLDDHAETIIGRKITEVLPTCRLAETISQGYSIWGETLKIKSKEFLVARFPLKVEGKTVGAMVKTLFPDQTIAKEIMLKLSQPAKKDCIIQGLCTCRDIIGETQSMLYVKKLARRASRTSSTLLITGESGTGKEVIAQAIHTRSVRREAPFVSVNCGAIPENLLESELFGYVDGAFTGAKKGGKPGKFELANGGSILLDEIGDMPLYMQVKILRVLQERAVWRIGATTPTILDVRVMASTNTDLKTLVKEKQFRQDLYYRLNVLEICLPPLRERLEDLPLLTEALIHRINQKIGSDARGITIQSMQLLKRYSWPGNVRELENILEQAVNWSEEPIIDMCKIPIRPWEAEFKTLQMAECCQRNEDKAFRNIVEETEKDLIIKALETANGNKALAARTLHMQRSVLYKKLERMGLK